MILATSPPPLWDQLPTERLLTAEIGFAGRRKECFGTS